MAETGWPYVSTPTTDTEYSWLFREFMTGITRSNGTTTLAGSAGTGMTTRVEAGRAMVLGFMYRNTAQVTLTHTDAAASTRVDIVVLRLDVTATPATNRLKLAIVTGTPGAGAPALTQTDTGIYEYPLYQVTIPGSATSITSGMIVDLRVWRGSTVNEWTTAGRPGNPLPRALGYNSTLGRWETWNGSSWVEFSASSVNGVHILKGTVDPVSGDGVDGDVYHKYQP